MARWGHYMDIVIIKFFGSRIHRKLTYVGDYETISLLTKATKINGKNDLSVIWHFIYEEIYKKYDNVNIIQIKTSK